MKRAGNTWNPRSHSDVFRRELDAVWDRLLGEWQRHSPGAWEPFPPIESYKSGNTLTVRADLPSVDPKDIEVVLHGNQLTIRGERKAASDRKEQDGMYRETPYGSFARTILLPLAEGTPVESPRAHYNERTDILEISIPLPDSTAAKTIPVELAGPAQQQPASPESTAHAS
jgi:HSP20 family protein